RPPRQSTVLTDRRGSGCCSHGAQPGLRSTTELTPPPPRPAAAPTTTGPPAPPPAAAPRSRSGGAAPCAGCPGRSPSPEGTPSSTPRARGSVGPGRRGVEALGRGALSPDGAPPRKGPKEDRHSRQREPVVVVGVRRPCGGPVPAASRIVHRRGR